MDYNVLLTTVLDSSPEDWQRVERPSSSWNGFDNLYVFRPHMSVSLAWGAEYNGGRDWAQKWSPAFPDKQVFGHWAQIRWNGAPVHSELLLSVDGGRAWLPMGTPDDFEKGIQVSPRELAFARLVDQVARGGRSDFDEYARTANITVC